MLFRTLMCSCKNSLRVDPFFWIIGLVGYFKDRLNTNTLASGFAQFLCSQWRISWNNFRRKERQNCPEALGLKQQHLPWRGILLIVDWANIPLRSFVYYEQCFCKSIKSFLAISRFFESDILKLDLFKPHELSSTMWIYSCVKQTNIVCMIGSLY